MTPTRYRDLAAIAVVATLLGNILVQLTYSTIPALPVAAGVTLGVLAVAEFGGGIVLRRRIERRGGAEPVPPLVAARAVLLAKASSVAGAVIAGLWAGLLVHTVPRADVVVAAFRDSVTAGIGLLCALLLVGSALWLEYCCRAPDEPDDSGGAART
ncbi:MULTISPECIES: DUF3180 domain-containing protein [Pseudonocardia]|uniref:DUF3180 domain-containing protein n=1 Tax=Pseudonocardia TaxID=1847 RepID=UPI000A2831C5|nr:MULTISPECIES: DUF3180 domain-containing protein [Pseudonocardia]